MTGPLAPTNDRIWGPFRALVNLLVQPTRFYGTYEYTITSASSTAVSGTPNDTSLGLPSLNNVELRADSIATQTPTTGNLFHVIFVNGDPAKPKCSWTQPTAQSVTIGSTNITLATGSDYVALAGLVKGELTKIALALAGAAAPSGGGAVTYTNPYTTPGNVAASDVKAT
jgi:hypothetical protein